MLNFGVDTMKCSAAVARVMAVCVIMMLAASAAAQQAYPNRLVRMIVPYAPGGGSDVLSRLLAQGLGDLWKQSVIVENRPGAGATIGTDMVAKAAPNGYTLLFTAGTIALSSAAYPNLSYDVVKDFAPITLIAQSPYVLAVNPSVKAKSLGELVQLARGSPGKLNFGSPGTGTVAHLVFELLRSKTGIDVVHIPYKGSTPGIMAAVSGQVDFVINSPPAIMELARAQKLRVLAISSGKRTPHVPNVPTFMEAGIPDFDAQVWLGLLAPAATPSDVVRKIHDDTVKVLSSPALVERFGAEGFEVVTKQPEEFGAYIRAEVKTWGEVIKQAGIKFE